MRAQLPSRPFPCWKLGCPLIRVGFLRDVHHGHTNRNHRVSNSCNGGLWHGDCALQLCVFVPAYHDEILHFDEHDSQDQYHELQDQHYELRNQYYEL